MGKTQTPAAVLKAYEAKRKTFEEERAKHDESLLELMAAYAGALFREEEGIHVLLIAGYQGEMDRLEADAAVTPSHTEMVWKQVGFEGDCPKNEYDQELTEGVTHTLMRFWDALERKHGCGWCVALVRDPESAPHGVAVTHKEYWPGY